MRRRVILLLTGKREMKIAGSPNKLPDYPFAHTYLNHGVIIVLVTKWKVPKYIQGTHTG